MTSQLVSLKILYEQDYDQWLITTLELLRCREVDQLDYEHLIEELEALGNEQKRAVESLLEQIIRHLLFCDYWHSEVERNYHHWQAEVIGFRTQLRRRLTTNLRQHLQQELDDIYQDALKFVQAKTQLEKLPDQCPYSLEEIIN